MDSLGKVRFGIQYPPSMLLQDAIEWPDEVEVLVGQLEGEPAERDLTRE